MIVTDEPRAEAVPAEQPDFAVDGGGTMYTVTILSEAGQEWVEEHVDVPDWMWLGESIFAVEHRYIADIVVAIQGDGLRVE